VQAGHQEAWHDSDREKVDLRPHVNCEFTVHTEPRTSKFLETPSHKTQEKRAFKAERRRGVQTTLAKRGRKPASAVESPNVAKLVCSMGKGALKIGRHCLAGAVGQFHFTLVLLEFESPTRELLLTTPCLEAGSKTVGSPSGPWAQAF
jgi:hypothetical protein